MRINRGQALIEWTLLLPLFILLFMGLYSFGQWFLIRQQLIMLTRETAMLYSSGRIKPKRIRHIIQEAARQGHPSLILRNDDIVMGHYTGHGGGLFRLDQVVLHYNTPSFLHRYFPKRLEESCVIRHAPSYEPTGNPPVPW